MVFLCTALDFMRCVAFDPVPAAIAPWGNGWTLRSDYHRTRPLRADSLGLCQPTGAEDEACA